MCHVFWDETSELPSVGCDPDLFSSVAQLCPTLCNPLDCSTPGFPVHHQLPEFAQTHAHWVSDAIQPSCPLLSPSPPAFNLSQHQGLSESVLWIRWLKYWSFSFSLSPSNEYSGLISFRMDWLDLLAVQGALKSLLQHHTSSAYACKLVHTGEERGWRERRLGSFSLLCFALTSVLMRVVPRPLVKRLQGP